MINEKMRLKNRIVELTDDIAEVTKLKIKLELKTDFNNHIEREYYSDAAHSLNNLLWEMNRTLESMYKDYEDEYL